MENNPWIVQQINEITIILSQAKTPVQSNRNQLYVCMYIYIYICTRCDQKNNHYFKFFRKRIYLFINNYRVLFKVIPTDIIHLCLETLPKRPFWYHQQLLFRYFFYFLNRNKTLSFHWCLLCWEEEKVGGHQVRWIRWLRHDYNFVFGQKLPYKHRYVSWCVNMVQSPWLVFSQFCAFLTNCFM